MKFTGNKVIFTRSKSDQDDFSCAGPSVHCNVILDIKTKTFAKQSKLQ